MRHPLLPAQRTAAARRLHARELDSTTPDFGCAGPARLRRAPRQRRTGERAGAKSQPTVPAVPLAC